MAAVEGGRNRRFVVYEITLEIEWSDSGWCWCSMQKNEMGMSQKMFNREKNLHLNYFENLQNSSGKLST